MLTPRSLALLATTALAFTPACSSARPISQDALVAALKTARPGDTLRLSPGPGPALVLQGLSFDPPVTITSADPNAKAVITKLKIKDSTGLLFNGVELGLTDSGSGYGVGITNSHAIHFDHVDVHGPMIDDPSDNSGGITVTRSTDVAVSNSEFHLLRVGLNVGGTVGVMIANNIFHDIRIDGVELTGDSQVQVLENAFKDFHHLPGDHSDAIQFWTAGRKPDETSSDITVRGNVIAEGAGLGMQGVFMRDEVGTLPYGNVKIMDNVVLGGNWNGIFVGHATDVEVSGNYLAAQVHSDSSLPNESRLQVKSADHAIVSGNQASTLAMPAEAKDSKNKRTKTLQDTSDATVRDILAKRGDLNALPENIRRAFGISARP